MEITKNQLNEMLQGNIVITVNAIEEMELINLLVDNGYGNDLEKKSFAQGVFMWAIKSKRDALLKAVESLKINGIEVLEASSTSPFTNYYSNTVFFVKKSDIKDTSLFQISFVENKMVTNNKETISIYDLKPF